jgi:hypothetical protein
VTPFRQISSPHPDTLLLAAGFFHLYFEPGVSEGIDILRASRVPAADRDILSLGQWMKANDLVSEKWRERRRLKP